MACRWFTDPLVLEQSNLITLHTPGKVNPYCLRLERSLALVFDRIMNIPMRLTGWLGTRLLGESYATPAYFYVGVATATKTYIVDCADSFTHSAWKWYDIRIFYDSINDKTWVSVKRYDAPNGKLEFERAYLLATGNIGSGRFYIRNTYSWQYFDDVRIYEV